MAFISDGGELFPGSGLFPTDKILMGDGAIAALRGTGQGENGPDWLHAHEFAHHVQAEIPAFGGPRPSPEESRRIELMADAFGAYYSAHARGASFQTKRIVDVVESAFGAGDCRFDDPIHHGTPNQRGAAAAWGAGIADSARPQGKIEPSAAMLARFEAHFPVLIAPDA